MKVDLYQDTENKSARETGKKAEKNAHSPVIFEIFVHASFHN